MTNRGSERGLSGEPSSLTHHLLPKMADSDCPGTYGRRGSRLRFGMSS